MVLGGADDAPLGVAEVGDGPTLVAVHGALTGGRLTFGGVSRRWAAAGRRVLIPDRPGFERTPLAADAAPPGTEGQAQRLLATIDAHADGPVDGLGCSYGGLILLHALQRRPAAFRSITIVESAVVDLCPSNMVEPDRLMAMAHTAHAMAADDLAGAFRDVFATVDPPLLAALATMMHDGEPGITPLRSDLAVWDSRLDRNALSRAVSDDPAIPVLTVSGGNSHPAFRTFGSCTAAALSGRHVVLPDAGHAAHLHPGFPHLLQEHLTAAERRSDV